MTQKMKDLQESKIQKKIVSLFYFQQFYLIILDTYRILATFFHLWLLEHGADMEKDIILFVLRYGIIFLFFGGTNNSDASFWQFANSLFSYYATLSLVICLFDLWAAISLSIYKNVDFLLAAFNINLFNYCIKKGKN